MRSKLVQNGDGQRHDSRIDGPDEEFGCSFFTRSRSKSSCTELCIDDNQATRLKTEEGPTSPSLAVAPKYVRTMRSQTRRNTASMAVLVRHSRREGECRDLLLYSSGRLGRSLVVV